jgi:hypothetical protein
MARVLLVCMSLFLLAAGGGQAQNTGASSSRNLRGDTLRVLEAEGMKDYVTALLKQTAATGKASVAEACAFCTAQFHNEFAKRFALKLRVADLMALYAEVYEKHYTPNEIVQLVVMNETRKKDASYAITQVLGAKIEKVKSALQSGLQEKTAEYTGKVGSEVFIEIEKEHPDWVKRK